MQKRFITSTGFTLIELVIVIAIVALLAMFAYPNYTQHVRKTERKAAIGKALELASRVEQFRTHRFQYPSAQADLDGFSQDEPKYRFVVTPIVANGETTGYSIVITPVAGTDQVNDACGTLTYNNAGNWTFSTGLTEEECI